MWLIHSSEVGNTRSQKRHTKSFGGFGGSHIFIAHEMEDEHN